MPTVKDDLLAGATAPSYWSDLKNELARKGSDLVADLAHKNGEGEISDREFRLVVDGVYDVLMGLAPREFTDMLYALRAELPLTK